MTFSDLVEAANDRLALHGVNIVIKSERDEAAFLDITGPERVGTLVLGGSILGQPDPNDPSRWIPVTNAVEWLAQTALRIAGEAA